MFARRAVIIANQAETSPQPYTNTASYRPRHNSAAIPGLAYDQNLPAMPRPMFLNVLKLYPSKRGVSHATVIPKPGSFVGKAPSRLEYKTVTPMSGWRVSRWKSGEKYCTGCESTIASRSGQVLSGGSPNLFCGSALTDSSAITVPFT